MMSKLEANFTFNCVQGFINTAFFCRALVRKKTDLSWNDKNTDQTKPNKLLLKTASRGGYLHVRQTFRWADIWSQRTWPAWSCSPWFGSQRLDSRWGSSQKPTGDCAPTQTYNTWCPTKPRNKLSHLKVSTIVHKTTTPTKPVKEF